MALDIDGEGEIGLAGGLVFLEIAVDLREKNGVLRVDGGGAGLVVPLVIAVPLKAQIAVDILAVVEPLIVGVAALHRVALIPEVPDIGVGGGAEILVGGEAGEEGPLGIHRSVSTVPPAKMLVTRFPVRLSASS